MADREWVHEKRITSSVKRQIAERVGQRYGRLVIQAKGPNDSHHKTRWWCLCDCGTGVLINWSCLRLGTTQSCGCYRKEVASSKQKHQLVGHMFGELTVLEKKTNSFGNHVSWVCQCSCGNKKQLRSKDLVQGRYTSCGHKTRTPKKSQDLVWEWDRFKAYSNNAAKDNREFALSFEEFTRIVRSPCHYCGGLDEFKKGRAEYKGDRLELWPSFYRVGIDRVDSGIGYKQGNVVSCCRMCNKMKMEYKLNDWFNQIRKIFNHMELGKTNS